MRPAPFAYISQAHRAAVAAAEHYERRLDRETAQRFWRDADGWRRLAAGAGIELRAA